MGKKVEDGGVWTEWRWTKARIVARKSRRNKWSSIGIREKKENMVFKDLFSKKFQIFGALNQGVFFQVCMGIIFFWLNERQR